MGGGERHSGKLAEVLAATGWQVDLVGPTPLTPAEIGARLGLDLTGVRLRVVADRGDAALAEMSAQYDLFVNVSHMSRLAPRARRNVFLCYFPTPYDAPAPGWQRWVLRTVAPRLTVRNPG